MSAAVIKNSAARIGFAGARHPHLISRAKILATYPGASVVGFFEEDESTAVLVARELGLGHYGRLSELLDSGLDIVIVEALDPSVPDLAIECSGRVGAILLEKPGAHNPAAGYNMAKHLADADTIVEFGYEMHYSEAMAVTRHIVASGCLGQVTLARFHGGCPVGCGLELWQSLSDDLGGLGYTEGCHIIELVVDLFGLPTLVSAVARKLPAGEVVASPFYKAELFEGPAGSTSTNVQVGTCLYEDVLTATLVYGDRLVTVDLTAWEAGNWVEDWGIQIYGTNGTVNVNVGTEDVRLKLREARGGYDAGATAWTAAASGLGYMYRRQLDSLISRVRGKSVPEKVDLGSGIAVLQVLSAIYDSAAGDGASRRVLPATGAI